MTHRAEPSSSSQRPEEIMGAAGVHAKAIWHQLVGNRSMRQLGTFLAYVGVVSLITFCFPDWVFNFDTPEDGPSYLGFMFDLVGQTHRFASHPMAELMSAFWLGHPFYSALPPLVANFLYKILLVSLLLYLMHQTATRLFGGGYGLAAAILVATNAHFFQILGSEYVEAMVVFYLTVVLYLLVRSAIDRRRRWAWLLGAGSICLVSSAFLTLAYLPGLGMLYLLLKRKNGRPWFEWSDAWIGAGAASCFALFCLAHRVLAGKWFYMASSVTKAQSFLAMNRTPGPVSEWFGGATWLFPCIIVVVYVLTNLGSVSPRLPGYLRQRRPRLGASGALAAATLISVGSLSYLQFVKYQGTVSDRYYYNQLIPLVSLTLVGIISREFGPVFGARRVVMMVCTIAPVWFENTARGVSALNLLWFCLVALAVTFFTRNVPRLVQAAVANTFWIGLVALSASLSTTWTADGPCRPKDATYIAQDGATKRIRSETFAIIVAWMNIVRELDTSGQAWLWYDSRELLGPRFRVLSFASHLFQASLINEYLPDVVVPDNNWRGPIHRRAAPGMEVLIPTAMGEQKLKALEQNLAQQGMGFQLLGQRPFVSGRFRCDVFHVRIVAL